MLLGAATAKLSRLVAKDRVLAVVRAPFTRFDEDTQRGEVSESARGTGVQRALGELLVCEYCLAQWVSAGFVVRHARAAIHPGRRGGVRRLRGIRRAEHRALGCRPSPLTLGKKSGSGPAHVCCRRRAFARAPASLYNPAI